MAVPAFEFRDVSKRYGPTIAVDGLSLAVDQRQVHALLGENGAGKSTLVKMLSGLVRPDAGTISVFGEQVVLPNARAAHRLGIQTAFQETLLVGDLTVLQNMHMPYEPATRTGQLRLRRAEEQAVATLQSLGLKDIDLFTEARNLDLPSKQKVAIAKAISREPRILLLDEPTSALTHADVDWLGGVIAELRERGMTIVFVSHRMREVRLFCDRLSVLRNGQHVGTYGADEVSDGEVVRLVIGRTLEATYPPKKPYFAPREEEPVLATKDLSAETKLHNVSLALRRGEVLGVAGLEGMGQRELFNVLFGVEKLVSGKIAIDGKPIVLESPVDAIRAGISLVPEDRKTEGLLLKLSGQANVSLPVVDRFSRFGWIFTDAEARAVDQVLARTKVPPRALYEPAGALSGGNQQKLSIAKWLLAESRILLMFDPTRGVDVGTKFEIYSLIRELAKAGASILFYSTEAPEVANLCDRVLVMYRGRIVEELEGEAVNEENIMGVALGQKDQTTAPIVTAAE